MPDSRRQDEDVSAILRVTGNEEDGMRQAIQHIIVNFFNSEQALTKYHE
jgi:hypothetical protein